MLVARLMANGTFISTVELDEVTQTKISVKKDSVYVYELDEVSSPESKGVMVPMRQLKNGTLQISGIFNEVDSLSQPKQ
jgi:hypothetical protein